MHKLQQNQAIRVTQTQTVDGYIVLKGTIGYVTQSTGDTDTYAQVYFPALSSTAMRVAMGTIKPFAGNIEDLAARALGFDRLDKCLQLIQRKCYLAHNAGGANRILGFRLQMHITSMIDLLEWTAEEAAQDFNKGEEMYRSAQRGPYRP